jgi:hypothetical protein
MSARRIEAEMGVHDRPEFGRRLQPRQQRGGRPRRHRQHHGVVRPDRDRVVAELQFADAAADMPNSRSSCPNRMLAPPSCNSLIAGSTSTALRPSRAIRGRQACPPASRVSRTTAPARPGGPLGRIDVQRRQQQRLHQPLVQRSLTGNRIADQFARRCPYQRHQCEIIEQAGVRHPAGLIEHPKRQPAFPEIELPALPGAEVDEGKLGALRPDQPRLGADRSRISERVAVAREQQVIAVVDGQVGGGVEIGPAAAAGLLRGLVDMHRKIRVRQPNGGREARNSSADDVNGVWHQMKA